MGRSRNILFIALCLAMGMELPLTGCASSRNSSWIKKPKSSQDYLDMALEAPGADDRRKGVVGLSDSRDGQTDWAMKVYDTVARTDRDTMVRCAAIRAMAPASGAAQIPTIIKLLAGTTQRSADCRAAPAALRWEAAKLLLQIVRDYTYDESQRPPIIRALLDRLARDTDRNVRLTTIETLAYFAERPIPEALVDAMDGDDFAIQHAAEESLIALTGHTHNHDAKAWRKWLADAQDPFENAGQIPEGSAVKSSAWGEWPW
ncbi:MAG TPA: HEAT repeat domain-containing protein [Phycisphaerae bacterium]|nr:HEAT repeat domain-containing protein [Phycisphaerae bacterium]